MHPDIARRFEALEVGRQALVDRVRAMPAEKRNQKPAPGQFSPAELIMHMALVEQSNMDRIRKNPPSSMAGKKVRYGPLFKFTIKAMNNPARQLPAPGNFVPKGSVDLDEADRKWADLRTELKGYLDQVEDPDRAFSKFIFWFGTLSASDYLASLEGHTHYHTVRFPQV